MMLNEISFLHPLIYSETKQLLPVFTKFAGKTRDVINKNEYGDSLVRTS